MERHNIDINTKKNGVLIDSYILIHYYTYYTYYIFYTYYIYHYKE